MRVLVFFCALLAVATAFTCEISVKDGEFEVTKGTEWPRDAKDCSWRGKGTGVYQHDADVPAECDRLREEFLGRANCSTAVVSVSQDGDTLEGYSWSYTEAENQTSCELSVFPVPFRIGATNCSVEDHVFSHCGHGCDSVRANLSAQMAVGKWLVSQQPPWLDQPVCPLTPINMTNCTVSDSPFAFPTHCGEKHICSEWSAWTDCTNGVMVSNRTCNHGNETRHTVCPHIYIGAQLSPPSSCFNGYQYRLSIATGGGKSIVKEVCGDVLTNSKWGNSDMCQLRWGAWSGACKRGNTNSSLFVQRELTAVHGSVCQEGVVGLEQRQRCPVCWVDDWQEVSACNETDWQTLNHTSAPLTGFCSPRQQIQHCGHFSRDCFVRNDSSLSGNCTEVSQTYYANRRSKYRSIYDQCGGYGVAAIDNVTCECYSWQLGLVNTTDIPCFATGNASLQLAGYKDPVAEPANFSFTVPWGSSVAAPSTRVASVCDHVISDKVHTLSSASDGVLYLSPETAALALDYLRLGSPPSPCLVDKQQLIGFAAHGIRRCSNEFLVDALGHFENIAQCYQADHFSGQPVMLGYPLLYGNCTREEVKQHCLGAHHDADDLADPAATCTVWFPSNQNNKDHRQFVEGSCTGLSTKDCGETLGNNHCGHNGSWVSCTWDARRVDSVSCECADGFSHRGVPFSRTVDVDGGVTVDILQQKIPPPCSGTILKLSANESELMLELGGNATVEAFALCYSETQCMLWNATCNTTAPANYTVGEVVFPSRLATGAGGFGPTVPLKHLSPYAFKLPCVFIPDEVETPSARRRLLSVNVRPRPCTFTERNALPNGLGTAYCDRDAFVKEGVSSCVIDDETGLYLEDPKTQCIRYPTSPYRPSFLTFDLLQEVCGPHAVLGSSHCRIGPDLKQVCDIKSMDLTTSCTCLEPSLRGKGTAPCDKAYTLQTAKNHEAYTFCGVGAAGALLRCDLAGKHCFEADVCTCLPEVVKVPGTKEVPAGYCPSPVPVAQRNTAGHQSWWSGGGPLAGISVDRTNLPPGFQDAVTGVTCTESGACGKLTANSLVSDGSVFCACEYGAGYKSATNSSELPCSRYVRGCTLEEANSFCGALEKKAIGYGSHHNYECRTACLWDGSRKSHATDCEVVPGSCNPLPGIPNEVFNDDVDDWRACEHQEWMGCAMQADAFTDCKFHQPTGETVCSCNYNISERLSDGKCAHRFGTTKRCNPSQWKQCDRLDLLDCRARLWWLPAAWNTSSRDTQVEQALQVQELALAKPYEQVPDSTEYWLVECMYTAEKFNATSMWDIHTKGGTRVKSAATSEYLGSVTHEELVDYMMEHGQCPINRMGDSYLSCSGWGFCNSTATDSNPDPVMHESFLRRVARLPRMSADALIVTAQTVSTLYNNKPTGSTYFMTYDVAYALAALKEVLVPFDVLKEENNQTDDAKCYFGSVFTSIDKCHIDSNLTITCRLPNTNFSFCWFGKCSSEEMYIKWKYVPEEGASSFLTHERFSLVGETERYQHVPWAASDNVGIFRYTDGGIRPGQTASFGENADQQLFYYGLDKTFITKPPDKTFISNQQTDASGLEDGSLFNTDGTYSYVWQSLINTTFKSDGLGSIVQYAFNRTSVFPVSINHMPNPHSTRFVGDPQRGGYGPQQYIPYAEMETPRSNARESDFYISYRTHDAKSNLFPFDFNSTEYREIVLNECRGHYCYTHCVARVTKFSVSQQISGTPSTGCKFPLTLSPYKYTRYEHPEMLGPIVTPVAFPAAYVAQIQLTANPPKPVLQTDGYRMCVGVSPQLSSDMLAFNALTQNSTGTPPVQLVCGSAVLYQSYKATRDPFGYGVVNNVTLSADVIYRNDNQAEVIDKNPIRFAALNVVPTLAFPDDIPTGYAYSRQSMAECYKVRSIESYRVEELVGGLARLHSNGNAESFPNLDSLPYGGYSPWADALFTATCQCMPGFCGANCDIPNTVQNKCPTASSSSPIFGQAGTSVEFGSYLNPGALLTGQVNLPNAASLWRNEPGASQCGPNGRYSYNTLTLQGTCLCDPGYYMDQGRLGISSANNVDNQLLCQPINQTSSGSTQGPTCVTANTYAKTPEGDCVCRVGWNGTDCSVPIKCPGYMPGPTTESFGTQCNGHGVCNYLTNPPTCVCDKAPNSEFYGGWSGEACDTFTWASDHDCVTNGGLSTKSAQDPVCHDCPRGRSGRVCELGTVPSYNGVACNGFPNNGLVCDCSGGTNGRNTHSGCACQIELQEFCVPEHQRDKPDCFGVDAQKNAANCPRLCNGRGNCSRADVNSDFKCECIDGFKGDFCDENVCPGGCSSHSYCNTTTAKCECFCDSANECWAGDDCSVNVVGICNNPGNTASAVNNLCNNHGQCLPSAANASIYACVCEEGFVSNENGSNPFCSISDCEEPCASANGFCASVGSTSACSCYKPWSGTNCTEFSCKDSNGEEIEAAEPVSINRTAHLYECMCINRTLTISSGCVSTGCPIYEPTDSLCGPVYDEDPEDGNFAGHSCVTRLNRPVCLCTAFGYETDPASELCKPICPVETSSRPTQCLHGEKGCFLGPGDIRYKCNCKDANYTTESKCTEKVCGENGHLLSSGSCLCNPGYTGSNCQRSACAHGQPDPIEGCKCEEWWFGPFCDQHVCGAHGVPLHNQHDECRCDPGWGGVNCTDPAVPPIPIQPSGGSPAKPNSTNCTGFVHNGAAVSCVCTLPYVSTGEGCEDGCFPGGVADGPGCACETGYYEFGFTCLPNCTNGGEFEPITQTCACPDGFEGNRCQTAVPSGGDDPPNTPGKGPDNRCKDSDFYVAPTVGSAPGAKEKGANCTNSNAVARPSKNKDTVYIVVGVVGGALLLGGLAYFFRDKWMSRIKYMSLA